MLVGNWLPNSLNDGVTSSIFDIFLCAIYKYVVTNPDKIAK